MIKRVLPLLVFASIILLSSCQKEVDTFIPYASNEQLHLGDNTTLQVFGSIIDENLAPIAGAIITIDREKNKTNEQGYFEFKNATTKTELGLVRIEKPGYFTVSKTINPGTSDQYKLDIILLKKELSGTFDAAKGGEISHENLVVDFPANALVNENNLIHQGEVRVYLRKLDPTELFFERYMPGILIGQTEAEKEAVLQSYGMIVMEMESSSGQALRVGENSRVSIKFPIIPAQIDKAPSEITLWNMTHRESFWFQSSQATKANDNYEFNHGHFNFLNLAIPAAPAGIKARLVNTDGKPIHHQNIKIKTKAAGSLTASLSSNGKGIIAGKVPSDIGLELFLLNSCGEYDKIAEIGTYLPNSTNEIGDIIVEEDIAKVVSVSGLFTKCDGNEVANGFILVQNDLIPPVYFPRNTDGSFNVQLLMCNSSAISLKGIDPDEGKVTERVEITSTVGRQDIGLISPCGRLSTYVVVSVEGEPTQLNNGYNLNYNSDSCFWSFSNNVSGVKDYYEFVLDCNSESNSLSEYIPVNLPLDENINRRLILPINGAAFVFDQKTFPIHTIFTTSLAETEPYFAGRIWGHVNHSNVDHQYDIKFKLLNQ